MSYSLYIPVLETAAELRKYLKEVTPLLQPRIRMLLVMLKQGDKGISKRELMESVGVSGQSIQTWRTNYRDGGLALLLQHGYTGFKPSIFTEQEEQEIKVLLNNPQNNINGYKDLQEWCSTTFKKEYLYNSVMKYAINKFGTKIKVARKYHARKDETEVEAFKKTSVKSAKTLLRKKK
jgi:transposase